MFPSLPTLVHLRLAGGVPVIAFPFPGTLETLSFGGMLEGEFILNPGVNVYNVVIGNGYQHVFTVKAERDGIDDFNKRFVEAMNRFLVGPMNTYTVRWDVA
ncbi:MAG: hypothetical protein ABI599_02095 [Flavobacteriales bacterium]